MDNVIAAQGAVTRLPENLERTAYGLVVDPSNLRAIGAIAANVLPGYRRIWHPHEILVEDGPDVFGQDTMYRYACKSASFFRTYRHDCEGCEDLAFCCIVSASAGTHNCMTELNLHANDFDHPTSAHVQALSINTAMSAATASVRTGSSLNYQIGNATDNVIRGLMPLAWHFRVGNNQTTYINTFTLWVIGR